MIGPNRSVVIQNEHDILGGGCMYDRGFGVNYASKNAIYKTPPQKLGF
jgi:hypothetical protein